MTSTVVQRLLAWPAYRWVVVMAIAYFALAFFGTWYNYVDLHFNSTGIYDLSINQQSLSSTIHGNVPYPFYESPNCGRNARCSFLLVHPVLIAYALTLPYSLAQNAFTLFAIQDVILAAAALPLFAIARRITGSTRLAVVTAGIYLAWLPAFSGVFSFHWEAFLPLEMFTTFWLWIRRQFLYSIPIVICTYITLEIGSVFMFCLGLYFLLPWFGVVWKWLKARVRLIRMSPGPDRARLSDALREIRRGWFRPPVVSAAISLMVGSVLAYIALHEFVTRGGWLLGLPPLPAAYNIPLSQPVHAATFTLANLLTAWQAKLLFWFVILGTLAMIPLLAPKSLVLWGPWVAYTLLSTAGFYRMGNQYGFLAASVLFLGFVLGLARLQRWANGTHLGSWWTRFWGGGLPVARVLDTARRTTQARGPSGASMAPGSAGASRAWDEGPRAAAARAVARPPPRDLAAALSRIVARRRRRAWGVVAVVLTAVVVFNVFLNPLNPVSAGLRTQRPFAAQPNLGISGMPDQAGYAAVESVMGLIPSRAVAAVSTDLLTFVAGDPFAFPLVGQFNPTSLPFCALPPAYIAVALHAGTTLNASFLKNQKLGCPTPAQPKFSLYSDYGMVAWAPDTNLGGLMLFELGYTGPTATYGAPPVFDGAYYTPYSGLEPRQAGVIAASTASSSGYVVRTIYGPNNIRPTGRIFQTPNLNLQAGTYRVTVRVAGNESTGMTVNSSTNVATIRLAAFEYPIAQESLNASVLGESFKDGTWVSVTINVTLTYPVVAFVVLGTGSSPNFEFAAESVTISRL